MYFLSNVGLFYIIKLIFEAKTSKSKKNVIGFEFQLRKLYTYLYILVSKVFFLLWRFSTLFIWLLGVSPTQVSLYGVTKIGSINSSLNPSIFYWIKSKVLCKRFYRDKGAVSDTWWFISFSLRLQYNRWTRILATSYSFNTVRGLYVKYDYRTFFSTYSSSPQLRYPQLHYFRSYAILNWVQNNSS